MIFLQKVREGAGKTYDGVTQGTLSAHHRRRSPAKPGRRRRAFPKTVRPVTRTDAHANEETPAPKGNGGFRGICPANSSGCYLAFSRISTSRQFFVADSGRVSAMTTRSPMPAMFSSS